MAKTISKNLSLIIVGLIIVVIVVVGILLITHKSPKTNAPSLSPAQAAAAKQQVETNWKTFFAQSTSLSQREALLQDGSKFSQSIETEFTSLGSATYSATVTSVSLVNSTSANVLYTIILNSQPVLTNQRGTALLHGNVWQVSDATLCQLLTLGGSKPAACQTN